MKRWTIFLGLVVCVLMSLGLVSIGQAHAESEITAKGSVYGSEWNDKGGGDRCLGRHHRGGRAICRP